MEVEASMDGSDISFHLWLGLVTIWAFVQPTSVAMWSPQGGGNSLFNICAFLTSWLHLQPLPSAAGYRGILESSSSEEQSLRKLCGKRKQAILPRRSWRDMSVSENCLSWIWGWTLAKHIKGNWVRSFDFFFPLIPLKACISFLPVFPISMYANFLPLTYWKGKMHLNKQLWLQPLC